MKSEELNQLKIMQREQQVHQQQSKDHQIDSQMEKSFKLQQQQLQHAIEQQKTATAKAEALHAEMVKNQQQQQHSQTM